MNSLKITNNIIEEYQDEYLIIKDNSLTFLKDNEYNIEYYNCTNINLIINLKPNISVKLYLQVLYNDCSITKNEHKSLENTEFSCQE